MVQSSKHFRKRDAILACLRSTTEHPSAEWIYAQLKPEIPDLSLGTVYRNLRLFLQEGLIISVGTVDGLERFDAAVPEDLLVRAAGTGQVEACQITFSGICRCCQSGAKAPDHTKICNFLEVVV